MLIADPILQVKEDIRIFIEYNIYNLDVIIYIIFIFVTFPNPQDAFHGYFEGPCNLLKNFCSMKTSNENLFVQK